MIRFNEKSHLLESKETFLKEGPLISIDTCLGLKTNKYLVLVNIKIISNLKLNQF